MTSYYQEAKIKDDLAEAGVREVELSDQSPFLIEFREGKFTEIDAKNPEWIAAQKISHAHRFIGGTNAENELFLRACSSITLQGQVLKQCGGDIKAANEILGRYGGKLGSLTPGVDPAEATKDKKSKNPWLDESPAGEAKRISVIRSLGTRVAAEMAKAAGKTIAGQKLRAA